MINGIWIIWIDTISNNQPAGYSESVRIFCVIHRCFAQKESKLQLSSRFSDWRKQTPAHIFTFLFRFYLMWRESYRLDTTGILESLKCYCTHQHQKTLIHLCSKLSQLMLTEIRPFKVSWILWKVSNKFPWFLLRSYEGRIHLGIWAGAQIWNPFYFNFQKNSSHATKKIGPTFLFFQM